MNKKQKELYKELQKDTNTVLLDFYETKEHKNYEEQSKFYLEKRDEYLKEHLTKLGYFIGKDYVILNDVRIDLKEVKKNDKLYK